MSVNKNVNHDAKIVYREEGTSGPVLLLLHGYAGSVLHWQQIAQKLSKNFRVVVPSLTHLYMGREALTFSQQVDHFAHFLTQHVQGHPVHVVGTSYGGALAWGLSLKYPKLVDKVVLINPMPPDPLPRFAMPVLKFVFRWFFSPLLLALFLKTKMGKYFLHQASEVFRVERADWWERVHQLEGRKLIFVTHIISRFSFILKNENWQSWVELFAKWNHQTCLIFDVQDPLFTENTYLDLKQTLEKSGLDKTGSQLLCLHLHQAGHLAIQTKPDEITKMIEEFLDVKAGSAAA